MSPAKQYQDYLKWFRDIAQTAEGRKELREKRAGFNWQFLDLELEPYTYGFWCICTADIEKLKKAVKHNIEYNHARISDDNRYVTTPTGRDLINPEYLARSETAKALKKRYKTYSGSPEIASDIVFAMKQEYGDLLEGVATVERTEPEVERSERPGLLKRIWIKLFGKKDDGTQDNDQHNWWYTYED